MKSPDDEKGFVNLNNARSIQKDMMERIASRGHCPFCSENFLIEHKKPIIKKGVYWTLTENQWPYHNTERHFILIFHEHVERLSQIPPFALIELWEYVCWLEQEYAIPGGAIAMRFGDSSRTGATVSHLHMHLIVPQSPDITGYKPVRFRIGGH